MRKTLILTLVLCVFAAFAYAQTGGTGTGTGASASSGTGSTGGAATTGTGGKGGKHHGTAKAKKYKGYVTGVDQAAKSFNISSCKTCQDVQTFKVNDKTKYHPKGCGWDELKVGMHVSGTYKTDGGDNWAITVYCHKEKAAPPAKTGK